MAQIVTSQRVTLRGPAAIGRVTRSTPKRASTTPKRRSGNHVTRASFTSGGFSSEEEAALMNTIRAGPVVPRHEAGDPFGLLLRQRIVFLGNQVDDFTADAVISQLLLLDAQDPKKVKKGLRFILVHLPSSSCFVPGLPNSRTLSCSFPRRGILLPSQDPEGEGGAVALLTLYTINFFFFLTLPTLPLLAPLTPNRT